MGSLNQPELTLDCRLSSDNWVAKSTGEFIFEVSRTQSPSEKVEKLGDYVNRLQEEMKKIDAFKRELPLCMLLLADAIATVKKELIQCKSSIAKPIMEEFTPLKKRSTTEKDETAEAKAISSTREKMNWMSSVQLWNPESNPNTTDDSCGNNRKRKKEEINRPSADDLFHHGKNWKTESWKGCDIFPGMNSCEEIMCDLSGVTELSLRIPEINSSEEEILPKSLRSRSRSFSATNGQSNVKEQTSRKQRRCWSAELHRRFVCALQQLGGPQAATPKQIRELMQVDGLTNDEVKSHLQKYRLHTSRVTQLPNPPSAIKPGGSWESQEPCSEPSKQSNSHSGSPQARLLLQPVVPVA